MMKKSISAEFESLMPKYIGEKVQASFFLLIDTVKALFDPELIPDCLTGNDETLKIRDYILQSTMNLNEIVDYNAEKKDAFMELMYETENKIAEIGKCCYAYSYATNITESIAGHYERFLHYAPMEKDVPQDFDPAALIGDCMAYVEGEDESDEASRKAEIISHFPIRMTGQKYNDYIKTGLYMLMKNTSDRSSAVFVKIMKLKFFPFKEDCYGNYFHTIKEKINSLFITDFENIPLESFDGVWEKLDCLSEEISALTYYFEMLGHSFSLLRIILNFAPDFDSICGDNLIYRDIFFAFKENFQTEGYELIKEKFEDSLADITDRITDECIKMEKSIDFMLKKEAKTNSSPANETLIDMYKVINMIYERNLFFQCFPIVSEKLVSDQEVRYTTLDESIDGFIKYMNESIADLGSKRKKVIKQLFLDIIPCSLSDTEFEQYLNYSFEGADTVVKKLHVLDATARMFEDKGFIDDLTEYDDHDHKNHHPHDCDCGQH